jgi:hypothetical protein
MTQAVGNLLANGLTAVASRVQASPGIGCAIAVGVVASTGYCAWQALRGTYRAATSPAAMRFAQNTLQIGAIGVVATGLAKVSGSQESIRTGITATAAALVIKTAPTIARAAYQCIKPLFNSWLIRQQRLLLPVLLRM